jgi:transposase, IS5 family
MYQPKFHQLTFEKFHLSFGGKLDPENRWVKLAESIPRHVAEKLYAKNFPSKR